MQNTIKIRHFFPILLLAGVFEITKRAVLLIFYKWQIKCTINQNQFQNLFHLGMNFGGTDQTKGKLNWNRALDKINNKNI